MLSTLSRITQLFLTSRLFYALGVLAVLYGLAFPFPNLLLVGDVLAVLLGGLVVADVGALFVAGGTLRVDRETPRRLSNGDENPIRIHLTSRFPFPVRATVIDELPEQLQVRDQRIRVTLPPGRSRTIRYSVRPTRRGAYAFGAVNVYVASPLGLVQRRIRADEGEEVPVYPSFIQMEKYSLMAASNRLQDLGVKKIRRLGHTMEFDHIREYVVGDDYRTVNWKATARRGDLMVNEYQDERAQPVYCILNMGRVMEMPFDGLTLLDHSINASLVLSNVAVSKGDQAGLITFSDALGPVVPAERRKGQMRRIQERLYRLEPNYLESDYARLARYVRSTVRQRSLLILFTNFPALSSMQRQLPYLRILARHHPLVVVFFQNTTLQALTTTRADAMEDVYVKTMAEKFMHEKHEVVRALKRNGIYTILTPPEDLTVQTINQYLELKARGVV